MFPHRPQVLRNERGAIDIASVLGGYALWIIAAGMVVAAVVAAIMWGMNSSAKGTASSVGQAQSQYHATGATTQLSYGNLGQLADADHLLASTVDNGGVMSVGDRDQWAVAVRSGTERIAIASSYEPAPRLLGWDSRNMTLTEGLAEAVADANKWVGDENNRADGRVDDDLTVTSSDTTSGAPGAGTVGTDRK